MPVQSIIDKTIDYVSVPAVVGFERAFMRVLERDFAGLGKKVERYEHLLAVHGDRPHSAIICAHIDRHGLISLGGGEYAYAAQYIREIKYGENNQSSRMDLENIARRFEGENVFAYVPETSLKIGDGQIETCTHLLDSGDSIFRVNGMDEIAQGVPVAYSRMARVEGDILKGQIDNALSLAVVHALFQNGFEGTALLTTEEEIGKSWIHIGAYLEAWEVETTGLIVLDTSPYQETQPLDEGTVIFRNRDFSAEFNPALVAQFKARCEALGLPYQMKDEYLLSKGRTVKQLGSTELGRLVQNRGGRWSGATVQIPTMMYHTSNESTSRKAIETYYRFLYSILVEDPLEVCS